MAILLAACGSRPVPPIGSGPRYRPPPGAHAAGGLTCGAHAARTWIHLELFADGKVVVVPAGIGIRPPRRRDGAYVTGGRCRYPLYTEEPTGLVGVARPGLTLGDLFAVWGRPLGARPTVHVDGRRWTGRPQDIALTRHVQIVVQTGKPAVVPHPRYRFPPGH
ncbi:MAG: hypothetical protein QOI80_1674 [Solirubrobacteraceae bacterium]|nr:hypothetical protein [Solirubrobacteraceae bacterium]